MIIKKIITKAKKPLIILTAISLAFFLFSQTSLGKRLSLPAAIFDAIKEFLGRNELHACDYKDGMILLIKPMATGVGDGRYEAGDIVAIRDGAELCQIAGDRDPLGTDEKTKLLPLYYPGKLTEEQKRDLTEPEYTSSTDERGEIRQDMLKRRQVGLDYTQFLSDREILKIRSSQSLKKLPEIDLSYIIKKSSDQRSVVKIPQYLSQIELMNNFLNKLARKIIPLTLAGSGTKTICPSGQGCNYTDLSTWEGTEQGNLTGTGPAIAQIQGDWSVATDTTGVTIDGWTTTADDYIKIYTTAAARHNGKWDDSKYRLLLNYGDVGINSFADNVWIDGIQYYNSDSVNGGGIRSNNLSGYATAKFKLSNSIIKGPGTAHSGVRIQDGQKAYIWNNVFYSLNTGLDAPDWDTGNEFIYAYNNTISNSLVGISDGTSGGVRVIAKNNIAYKITGNAYLNINNADCANNLSGPTATTTPGSNPRNGVTVQFADEASDDFHLVYSDAGAKDYGTSSVSEIGFTDDIDGQTRSGSWDIGADEVGINKTQINTPITGRGPQGGLVGYWPFDGADMNATTAIDKSGQGNNGDVRGGAAKVPGVNGQALEFDGQNDYVNIDDSFPKGNSQRTISFWFNAKSFLNYTDDLGCIFCYDYGGNAGTDFSISVGNNYAVKLSFYNHDVITPQNALATNNWYQVAVVVPSGATLTSDVLAYINGSPQSLSTISGSPQTLDTDKSNIKLGARDDGYYFNGLIDEVRIYNRTLSQSEITDLYRLGAARLKVNTPIAGYGPQSGLVGHWTFDGQDTNWTSATAGTTNDKSGNNNTGTMTNMSRSSSPAAGIAGQALSFDGVDDYVNFSNPSSLNNIARKTVSAWIYPRSAGGLLAGDIVDKNQGWNDGWMFNICAAGDAFGDCNLGSRTNSLVYSNIFTPSGRAIWIAPNNSITYGKWQHVVVVYDNTSSSNDPLIYINGVSQTLTELAPPSGTVTDDSLRSLTTGNRGDLELGFGGLIDEVRIYNRVLSASEVLELYNIGARKVKFKQ